MPEREPSKLEAVLTQCPGLEFIMDGTERRMNRPKNKENQKVTYNGKKKTHTVKNNVITDMTGKVVFLSDTDEGKSTTRGSRMKRGMSFQRTVSCGRIRDSRAIGQKG